MNPLALTSITDFVLAAETLLLAGILAGTPKVRFSAAWYWSAMLVLLGLGALLGGIDHGFIQPASLPRYMIQRGDWIVLGATTFCLLIATAKQFFAPRVQRIVLAVGVIQFVASTIVVLLVDRFVTVVLNYAPVMILLLIVNCIGTKSGRGSWEMTAGILIMFAASFMEAFRVDYFSPLDHSGLYHLVSMIGVVFLFLGGRRLRGIQQDKDLDAS